VTRPPRTILLLAGTTEGTALAQGLADRTDLAVISSLAGRTRTPRLPPGAVRVGGFGGAAGLAAYLAEHGIDIVIDATHPFASRMGWNAMTACRTAGIPLLRLERPAWRPVPGDRWIGVEDWPAAAEAVRGRSRRVLLALGRQELAPFAGLDAVWFLIRSVEPPAPMPPFAQAELMLARGPFDLADERRLLTEHRIDTIVCKNSGGTATEGKLTAARELGIEVVMKQRPPRPVAPTVGSVGEALDWLESSAGG
jgi:precorrin-6A/cobalt-precorrin-6A reductase